MDIKQISGVVLAAGSGLRLDPISTPKPLVRIGTKPLIIWTIESLQRLGLENIWLVVGQHGDLIQKEIIGDPRIKSNIHFLRLPFQSRSMFQSLVYAVSQTPGSLLLTACDLVFEKYPLSPSDLDTIEPNTLQVLVSPLTKERHSGCHSLVRVAGISEDATVEDVGVDIPHATFYDVGIYLIGEEAKKDFDIPLESAVERVAFYQFLKTLFEGKKARLKFVAPGDWCDVNTAIDKIKAELLLKQKVRTPIASHSRSTHTSIASRNSYNFLYCKKKTTEIIVEPNILKHLWEYEIIPPASAHSTHYLITDTSLYDLVGKRIEEGFNARGYRLRPLLVPLGETVKKIEEYWRLMLEILAQGVDRCSIIINLGGGTINNVAGFIASTLFRGISLYHIPTTLLAQLDSTIDIKQAINTPYGKNLVGSFYAADKVIVDPSLLTFLPEEHIVNGLSESIKHGLVQDKGLLDYYDQYNGSIREPAFLEKVINWTIDLKVRCMVNEPDGDHAEMIKDYGHSIGHALEQYTGYEIHHGRAIAIGMCVSAEIARLLKVTTDKEVDMHYKMFRKYGLATSITPDANIDDFELVLKHDKTYMQGSAYMGLISELGCLWHENGRYAIPVDLEIVRKALVINQEKFSSDQKTPSEHVRA